MHYRAIKFSVRNHVAQLILNRPENANAINLGVAKEFMTAAIQCDEDLGIRAILLRGLGPMFSGGGDLKSFAEQRAALPTHLKEVTTDLHGAISRLCRQSAPTVCAVQGFTAGGGFSLAISCDLLVAAESAKFTMAYT